MPGFEILLERAAVGPQSVFSRSLLKSANSRWDGLVLHFPQSKLVRFLLDPLRCSTGGDENSTILADLM
jgi:hypothetical protein